MKGFTLIEFLLYIGLLGIILTVSGAIGLNILFGKAKLNSIEEVSQNSRFAIEKIASTIRNAQAINSPATSTNGTSLSLVMTDSSLNPTVFDLSSKILRITEGAGSAVNLTSDEVSVSDLQFTNISYTGTPGTVRIQITVEHINPDNRPEYDVSKTFYATANLRKL
jgi:Tfp pilus assembly protein PilW